MQVTLFFNESEENNENSLDFQSNIGLVKFDQPLKAVFCKSKANENCKEKIALFAEKLNDGITDATAFKREAGYNHFMTQYLNGSFRLLKGAMSLYGDMELKIKTNCSIRIDDGAFAPKSTIKLILSEDMELYRVLHYEKSFSGKLNESAWCLIAHSDAAKLRNIQVWDEDYILFSNELYKNVLKKDSSHPQINVEHYAEDQAE